MTEQDHSFIDRVNITDKVVKSFSDHPDVDYEIQAEAVLNVEQLREQARRDLGLNRGEVEIAIATYEQHLLATGQPAERNKMLEFMRQQLDFNNTMERTITSMGEYRRRTQEILRKEREDRESRQQTTDRMPEGFLNPKHVEAFNHADRLITETLAEQLVTSGVPLIEITRAFSRYKIAWTSRRDIYYRLHLIPDAELEPGEKPAKEKVISMDYYPASKIGRDQLYLSYQLPFLVPRKKQHGGSFSVDQILKYAQNADDPVVSYGTIWVPGVTEPNIAKLSQVITLTQV